MQNGSSRAPTLPDTATRRTTRQWMTSLMTFDICIFSWTEQKLPYQDQDLLILSHHELMCNKSGNSFSVWVPPNNINIAYLYPKHNCCDIKCYYLMYYQNENIQSNVKPYLVDSPVFSTVTIYFKFVCIEISHHYHPVIFDLICTQSDRRSFKWQFMPKFIVRMS